MTDLLALFEDLVRVETRIYNVLEDRLRDDLGLTLGQFQFLVMIDRRPGARVFDLAHEVAITIGATSKAVDRLEAAGWARRTVNPQDRRSSFVSLTPAGRRTLARARKAFDDEFARQSTQLLPARTVTGLTNGLHAWRRALEAEDRGFPGG